MALLISIGTVPAPRSAPIDFFRPSQGLHLRPSPTGRRLAVIAPAADGRRVLRVVEASDREDLVTVAGGRGVDVVDADWVNEERLVYRVADLNSLEPVVCAVEARAGALPRTLIRAGRPRADGVLGRDYVLRNVLLDGSNDVVVERAAPDGAAKASLWRLDTTDLRLRRMTTRIPEGVLRWRRSGPTPVRPRWWARLRPSPAPLYPS